MESLAAAAILLPFDNIYMPRRRLTNRLLYKQGVGTTLAAAAGGKPGYRSPLRV